MPKLAKNEIRLLALFLGAVFVALNLFGIRLWSSRQGALREQLNAAEANFQTAQGWLVGSEAIAPALAWIREHPPATDTSDHASTYLVGEARNLAEKNKLKVLEENLLPAPELPVGKAAVLQLKLAGPFPSLVRFLFDLQTPTAWREVSKITVRSDAEPPNVVVDMEIRQYYRELTSPSPVSP